MLLSDILNYAIYGVVGFFVLASFISGIRLGLGGQTVKFGLSLGSFVLSFIAMGKILPFMLTHMEGKNVRDFLLSIGINLNEGMANTLESINTNAAAYVMAVPLSVAVIPLLFVLCFFAIRGVLWFPIRAFRGALGFEPYSNVFLTRLAGGIVGAVQGVLIAAVILVPASGMLGTASSVLSSAKEKHPDSANTIAISYIYDSNFAPLESNMALQLVDQHLGFVYDSVGTVTMDGEQIDTVTATDKLFELFVLSGDLGVFDYTNLTEDNKAVISEIVDVIGEDAYLRVVFADVCKSFFRSIHNGQIILAFDEPLYSFLVSVVQVYETSDKTTIAEDLLTTKNVYFIFNDSGSFGSVGSGDASQSVFEAFLKTDAEGKSTISLVCDELHKHDRFDGVADQLSHLAMDILLRNVAGSHEGAAEKLESVKEGLNDVVSIKKDDFETEEEYKGAVSESLNNTLVENNIALPPEKLDTLTDIVIEEFGDLEQIDDLKMAEFMGKYYDVYASQIGSLPPGVEGLPDIGGGEGAEGSTEGTEGGADVNEGTEGGTEGTEGIEGTEGAEGTEGIEGAEGGTDVDEGVATE